MTISYNWLHEYLNETIEPNELSTILTSVGLEVESMDKFETVKGGLEGLIIGKVMECEQHPNADKLRLTKVDIGTPELLKIVCGAPNVAVGQTVVVATIGTTIYPSNGEPLTMKKAKIRGEESEGMICAEDEIGLGDNHDGIIILPEGTPIGLTAKEYYKLPASDITYEIGLTPNRMDAMSHLGVAKDVVAYLINIGKEVRCQIPDVRKENLNKPDNRQPTSDIEIFIENENLCARYAGLTISNIVVKESPEWMQLKLKAIGLRPINNIVDITNFVMHECGQPLHAFDLSEVKGGKIIVKTVDDKTKFIALDGKEIELNSADLMICNESEPMCIAGVYGGLQSGVKASTTSIFLESAWFLPDSIRKTSMRLGLRTDSATRFEKGADISNVTYALQRAASLIVDLAGGQISSEMMDIYPAPFEQKTIQLSYQKMRALAGKEYGIEQMKNILLNLGFGIKEETETGLQVNVPFSKTDITMQADVVEEIMRIDGLDNIPFTGKIAYSLPTETQAFKANAKQHIASQLVTKGFFEIFTNSITNAAYYPDNNAIVKMINSLSANLDTMRFSMLETGLEAVAYNLNRKNNQLKFFEFGKVYSQSTNSPLETGKESTFIETEQIALYLSGNYRQPHYTEKAKAIDIYFVRGIVESLFPNVKLVFESQNNGLDILLKNKKIGTIEEIPVSKLKQFDIKQAVWFAVLDWEIIKAGIENYKLTFTEIPKFPTMQRDLAMVVDKHVKYQDIQTAVKQAKSKLLQTVNLFDIFESEKLGKDKVSYAVNFSFYDNQKTLTDVEVETEMKAIIKSLETKVGAVVRGN
jgi:phenylalanyl-tRNA synthetase beta chain